MHPGAGKRIHERRPISSSFQIESHFVSRHGAEFVDAFAGAAIMGGGVGGIAAVAAGSGGGGGIE